MPCVERRLSALGQSFLSVRLGRFQRTTRPAARPRDPTRELEAHEAYQQILARKQKERETRAAGLMSAAYVHCWRRCSSLAARAANLAEKGWKLMWT